MGDMSGQEAKKSSQAHGFISHRLSSCWKNVILHRRDVHITPGQLSLPRFHLFGALWIGLELLIFIITLTQMDYSFESMDMTTQMLKSRSDQQALLQNQEQELRESGKKLEDMSFVTMAWGSVRDPSDYCGAIPGSQYYIYAGSQALRAVLASSSSDHDHRSLSESIVWPITRQANRRQPSAETKGANSITSSPAYVDGEEEAFTSKLLDLLLCLRMDEPLFDQRYIVSNSIHPCKGPGVFLNLTAVLGLCKSKKDFHVRLEVAGVRSLCIFGISKTDPLSSWSVPCIRFGTKDMESPDLLWILPELEGLWNRIKLSAWSWILLSILMRTVYCWTAVQVTRKSLTHLRTECQAYCVRPSKGNSCQPAKTAEESVLSSATLGESESEESKQADPCAIFGISSVDLRRFLTAASLGVACANNDAWYLGLAVLRQILGAIYGEILTGSAVTTPLAAWQALGMVAYHEAVIKLVQYGLTTYRITGRNRAPLSAITDVGILGYMSMLLLATTVQLIQLFDIDLFYFFRLVNAIIAVSWWLIFPACDVDGPCLYMRGDIMIHTLAAVYTSIFVIALFAAKRAWRGRLWSHAFHPDVIFSWHHYLGIIGCPHCGCALLRASAVLENSAIKEKEELFLSCKDQVYLGSAADSEVKTTSAGIKGRPLRKEIGIYEEETSIKTSKVVAHRLPPLPRREVRRYSFLPMKEIETFFGYPG